MRSFEVCTKVKEVSSFSIFIIVNLCSANVIKALANNLSNQKSDILEISFYFDPFRHRNISDLSTSISSSEELKRELQNV